MKIHNSPYFSLGLSIFSAIFYILYMKFFLGTNAAMLLTTILILYLFVMFKFHFIDITILFLIVAGAWKIYTSGMEHFENKQDRKKSKKKAHKEKMSNEDSKDSESDSEEYEEYEVSSEAGIGDEEGEPVKPPKKSYVDMGSTWMKAYNKLSPDQISGMKRDTKELMETQKALVETLQTMGPTVQQGMDLVNTFQKYFGIGGDSGAAPLPTQ